jgi:hypothetical protein
MASVTTSSADVVAAHALAKAPISTKRNFSRIIEQTWIWTVVGYSLLRFVVAWGAFSEHGANVFIFGIVDIGTAWPYGKGVALVCRRVANNEWAQLPLPLTAALGSFFAPYAYLWFAAGEMPSGMRVGMAICVSVLFVAATAGVIAKSRKLRREASEDVIEVREPAQAFIKLAAVNGQDRPIINLADAGLVDELIIDLTDDAVAMGRPPLTH